MNISPPPVVDGEKLNPWSTTFGKFPKMNVNRVSNRTAAATVTNTSVPEKVMSPSAFMRSFVRSGYIKVSGGVHGEVYRLLDTTKLQDIYGILQNKITYKNATNQKGTHVMIKIISVPKDEMDAWTNNTESFRRRYLLNVTRRTIRRDSKKYIVNKNSKVIPDKVLGQVYANVKANFLSRSPATRASMIKKYMQTTEQATRWHEVLQEGSHDASNHLYLVKAPLVEIDTPQGSIRVKASDVVPEFYFSGSSKEHGVYVIVMGVAHGIPVKNTNRVFTPNLVANIERALLTLAVSGVEHGDIHTGNMMTSHGYVKLIDFGMSSILPEKYRLQAKKALTASLTTLLQSGSWPEKNSNNIWYKPENGMMRYMNSYMMNKHGKNFSWYNPSGKMMRYVKTHVPKQKLDSARFTLWKSLLRPRVHTLPTKRSLHHMSSADVYSNL